MAGHRALPNPTAAITIGPGAAYSVGESTHGLHVVVALADCVSPDTHRAVIIATLKQGEGDEEHKKSIINQLEIFTAKAHYHIYVIHTRSRELSDCSLIQFRDVTLAGLLPWSARRVKDSDSREDEDDREALDMWRRRHPADSAHTLI